MIITGLSQAHAMVLRNALRREAKASRGAHAGYGRHVAMPDTWDNTGPVPPGWSGWPGEVQELDGDGEDLPTYCLAMPDGLKLPPGLFQNEVDILDSAAKQNGSHLESANFLNDITARRAKREFDKAHAEELAAAEQEPQE